MAESVKKDQKGKDAKNEGIDKQHAAVSVQMSLQFS